MLEYIADYSTWAYEVNKIKTEYRRHQYTDEGRVVFLCLDDEVAIVTIWGRHSDSSPEATGEILINDSILRVGVYGFPESLVPLLRRTEHIRGFFHFKEGLLGLTVKTKGMNYYDAFLNGGIFQECFYFYQDNRSLFQTHLR